MQYTIESRELTSEYTHKPSFDVQPRTITVEAGDVAEAIQQFVTESESELVSFSAPVQGRETIATVKKRDAVFLVRVYTN